MFQFLIGAAMGSAAGMLAKAIADDDSGQVTINLKPKSNLGNRKKEMRRMKLSNEDIDRMFEDIFDK